MAEAKIKTKVAATKATEVKAAEVATTEVKEEAKKTTKTAAKKAPAKKAVAKETVKKETTAKKAPAKKAAVVEQTVNLQFSGKSYTTEDLVKIAKDVWQYDLNQNVADFKTVELYVKPEEGITYYVINKEVTGSFFI